MLWAVVLVSLLTVATFFRQKVSSRTRNNSTFSKATNRWDYNKMKEMLSSGNVCLPAMIVDLDIFDNNAKHLIEIVRNSGKTLRIATKSIRSVELISRLQNLGKDVIVSFMTFSVAEANLLSEKGLDDFYVPYPTIQQCDIDVALDLTEKNKTICLTVDSVAHVERLDNLCERYFQSKGTTCTSALHKLRVAADLDVSYKLLGGRITLGPHRSRLDSVDKFAAVVTAASRSKHIKLVGAMGYEAHVAGLPDDNPYSPLPNPIIRVLKKFFLRSAVRFREDISRYCIDHCVQLDFFNGGGSGDIREACQDSSLTEVTAGSAFLQSKIFDYFTKNEYDGAFCFALQATRVNTDYICCQSGGFVASGSCSEDKFPQPFANPLKLQHYKDEGFGEVQTPLRILGRGAVEGTINVGDPVFFRPAKAGEIGEHFKNYYTKTNFKIVGKVNTYRGLGQVFY